MKLQKYHNRFTILVAMFLFSFEVLSSFVFAQEIILEEVEKQPLIDNESVERSVEYRIEAGVDKNALVDRHLLFNADFSSNIQSDSIFTWVLGDGAVKQGLVISHAYKKTGVYKVSLRVTSGSSILGEDQLFVTVSKDIITMIIDDSIGVEVVESVRSLAASQGISLTAVRFDEKSSDEFKARLSDPQSELRQSKMLLFWMVNNAGLTSFAELYQSIFDGRDFFRKTIFVHVGTPNSATFRMSFQNLLNVLNPEYFLIIPLDGIDEVVTAIDIEKIITQLGESSTRYELFGVHTQRDIRELSITNFLSYGINYLVNNGVSLYNIYFLLIIPLIVTVIAFIRQVVGVKTFGIYTPTIITLSFLSTGVWAGLLLFTLIIIVGTGARIIGKRLRFLYIPRMAILLTIVSLSIIGAYVVGIYFEILSLTTLSILPILLLIILAENFISAQMEKGTRSAIKLTLFTLATSILAYIVTSSLWIRTILLGYPELIFLTIIFNALLGRWTGLRIVEYYRFRKLLKKA